MAKQQNSLIKNRPSPLRQRRRERPPHVEVRGAVHPHDGPRLRDGLDEAVETLFADISALELGAHHGVMVLGFVNILSSLPDMLDGLTGTFLSDDEEEVEHTEDDSQDFARHQEASPPEPAEAEVRKAA